MDLILNITIDGIHRKVTLNGCKNLQDTRWFTDKLDMVCDLKVLSVKVKG